MFTRKISRRAFLTLSATAAASFTLDLKKVSACASRMVIKQAYPTVIIGAGLGGLTCGAYLARQGIPVTVVEQNDKPGGYATVFDRAEGKFTFDVSLHATSVRNNAMEQTLKNLDILNRIQIAEPEQSFLFKVSGMDLQFAQRNPEETIRRLSAYFPEEEDGIRSFIDETVAISDEADRFARRGVPFKILVPLLYPGIYHVHEKTLAEMLNEHIKNPALQNVLSCLWHILGGPPPAKISAVICSIGLGNYLKNGAHYIQTRSQDLSDALAETIVNAGGRIIYETPVEKIQVENGRVTGVSLSDNHTLPAQAVVSNASAVTTFTKMLPRDAVPPQYLEKLNTYTPGLSTYVIWLGLNKELNFGTKVPYIMVLSELSPDEDHAAYRNGDIERMSYIVTLYDNIYKGYSRPGTSTVTIMCMSGFEPWQTFEADYKNGRKKTYYAEKQRWADILLRRAEKDVLPGLGSMIEVMETATPLTNWSYTGNTNGAICGFDQSMDNAFTNRIKNRTPVKGLYLAGAWGTPCGGYGGAIRSGETTFQMMMEDWGA